MRSVEPLEQAGADEAGGRNVRTTRLRPRRSAGIARGDGAAVGCVVRHVVCRSSSEDRSSAAPMPASRRERALRDTDGRIACSRARQRLSMQGLALSDGGHRSHRSLTMIASSPSTQRLSAAWLLGLIAAALALALGLHGPIPHWASYHAFADARGWLGLPNAENVLSNLPFALIGFWGWRRAAGAPAWRCFSAALVCTAFGSALYHWAPGNALLVADRLPIAWACAALTCGFLGERVDARWASPGVLAAATLAASASVAWWWASERLGVGDLRAYLFVQFLPMLVVPAALLLRPPPLHTDAVRNSTWWTVLGLYGAAKLMELGDAAVFHMLAFTSGHTIKHLLAAAAAACLLRGLRSGSRR